MEVVEIYQTSKVCPLITKKQNTGRAVQKYIAACNAQKEISAIQKLDLLFRYSNNCHFHVFKATECPKLLDENQRPVTDPSTITELFHSYFSDLASSNKQTDAPVSNAMKDLGMLKSSSNFTDDQIIDANVVVEKLKRH